MYHNILQQVATINVIESFDTVSRSEQEQDFWATAESLKASLKFCAYQLAVMCAKGNYIVLCLRLKLKTIFSFLFAYLIASVFLILYIEQMFLSLSLTV